ncbi:MAG: SulP family inorganic anion transporter [Acidobacteriota bacterium]
MSFGKLFGGKTLGQDALASVVVFLVALPLCMGIALASGVPPAAGLITGIIGGLVAGSLSGCPLQVSGPAAGLAVIVYELVKKYGLEVLGPIVVAAGVMQIIAGALRAGQLFRSIAPAVVYGMLAGIGVLILAAQFHVMVDDTPRSSGISNLLAIPEAIYKSIVPVEAKVHHLAALVGVATIVTMLLWQRFAPGRVKWVPAALVGVSVATVLAHAQNLPIKYVDLPDDLFSTLRLPSMGAWSLLKDYHILLSAGALAFVASAETLLSATAVDQMHDGPRTKYNREMISQGVGNVLSGLVGGLPMTGVIVRSATNVSAGAKTRLSAVLHGVWMLALVAAAPGILRLIPTASLAAVLVYTGYKLINIQNIRRLLQYGRVPVTIYAATLVVIVAEDLLTGIVVGLVLSLGTMLYSMTHLGVETREEGRHVHVHLSGAATFIRLPRLIDKLERVPHQSAVHVHMHRLNYVDHACLDAIEAWEKQRNEKGATTVVEWQELMDCYRQTSSVTDDAELSSHQPLSR